MADEMKPQKGLIQKVMDMVKPGTPSANSTAGKLANRKEYTDYRIAAIEKGEEPKPYEQWSQEK